MKLIKAVGTGWLGQHPLWQMGPGAAVAPLRATLILPTLPVICVTYQPCLDVPLMLIRRLPPSPRVPLFCLT